MIWKLITSAPFASGETTYFAINFRRVFPQHDDGSITVCAMDVPESEIAALEMRLLCDQRFEPQIMSWQDKRGH